MNIKISKALFESAQLCRARNDVRGHLCGIAILPDLRIAATNGHVLFVGDKVECSNPIRETVILDVQKSPTQRYDHVVINTKTLGATFRDKSNNSVCLSLVEVVSGAYPDVDKVLSSFKKTPTDSIGFNSSYLLIIGKIGKLFNPRWMSANILLSGKEGVTITEFSSNERINGKLIIMPMRLD